MIRAVRRQRITSPVEFSAGLVRMLEIPRTDVRLLALALACDHQGQELFNPPNVKGWDGGKTWLNSTTVLERGNWCNDVIWGNADFGLKSYDPLAWAERHGIAPEKAAAALLDLLLQDDASRPGRGKPGPACRSGRHSRRTAQGGATHRALSPVSTDITHFAACGVARVLLRLLARSAASGLEIGS